MEKLAKNINLIENGTAKYIFNKYIRNKKKPDASNDDITYEEFLDTIINKLRSSNVISQEQIIKEDIKKLELANEDYEQHNIVDFSKNGSFPDVLRCTYIRKYKNKYSRCNNKIMDDDSDICYIHQYYENIYYDQYNELFEKIMNE